MSDLVRYKRPAQVVSRRPLPVLPQRVDTVVGTKRAILREVARLKQTRELVDTGALSEIKYGPEMGLYELRVVVRQAPASPRWAKVCVGAGSVMLGLAALVGSAAWLLSALTVPALVSFLATVLGAFGLWVWAKYGRGRVRGVTVTTVTTVEIR